MFYLNTRSLISLDKINFIVFKGLMINRLLNFNYNDRLYNVFFSVGDIISLEVLRTESKFKNLLKHVTIHRYIGRVIARNNKGINTSVYIKKCLSWEFLLNLISLLFSPLIVSFLFKYYKILEVFFFHSKLYVFRV
jgi:ribosomal protein L19